MLAHLKQSQVLIDWLGMHNHRHNSPIVQIFTSLFGRPWVVISDFREIQVKTKHTISWTKLTM
jgi:hypothetical protein